MAFLFKSSKKNHDRALANRDGNAGSQSSQGSIQGPGARGPRGEKEHRATPTGSLNSLENDGTPSSPDRGHARRGGSVDQTQQQPPPQQQAHQQSDLPVGGPSPDPFSHQSTSLLTYFIASERASATGASHEQQCLTLSLVATEDHIHLLTPESISSIWRCRQFGVFERRRHISDGWSD